MKSSAGIAALILAAGYSSRMRAFKPLLRIGRTTFVERALACFREAGVDDITVVVGYRAGEIIPVLESLKAKWVLNSDYDAGMLSSVLTGARNLEPDVRAFFLLPVDIPLVKPETVQALIRAYRQGSAPVVYPTFKGLRGHPPLISRDGVAELPPTFEGGMRAFLQRFRREAIDMDVADEGILMDCDTPADYRALQIKRLESGCLPAHSNKV